MPRCVCSRRGHRDEGRTRMDTPQRHRDTELERNQHHQRPNHRVRHRSASHPPVGSVRSHLQVGAGDRIRCAGLSYAREVSVPAIYKGRLLGSYRLDFVVNDRVVVEVKSVERMNPIFETQVITYLGLTKQKARPSHQLQLVPSKRRNSANHSLTEAVVFSLCLRVSVSLWLFERYARDILASYTHAESRNRRTAQRRQVHLFNAITRTRNAEAANYPFCTIDPNVGIVIGAGRAARRAAADREDQRRDSGGDRVRRHRRPGQGREHRVKGSATSS